LLSYALPKKDDNTKNFLIPGGTWKFWRSKRDLRKLMCCRRPAAGKQQFAELARDLSRIFFTAYGNIAIYYYNYRNMVPRESQLSN